MNAKEQREKCPVSIGQSFADGTITYILGDKKGWDIWIRVSETEERLFRVEEHDI